eukprot:TRINITY_DN5039_c0_g1_i1.p2 TRINITY_DN5039_c0_g1~~TRINITY_DN5039_c0_g1_i1.p2  ORF type:complete len:171 (+),score=24.34 TRINITY_DN5039_c0_g1_i1:88-600(+)
MTDSCTYDDSLMNEAFVEAELAKEEDEVPIGCIFSKSGVIVARGRNRTNIDCNGCAHAELVAISELKKKNPTDYLETLNASVLYVTVEPCIMCISALLFHNIKKIFYGCSNDRFGGCGGVLPIHQQNPFNPNIDVSPNHQKERAISLLRSFYESENKNCPEIKRRKKLKS